MRVHKPYLADGKPRVSEQIIPDQLRFPKLHRGYWKAKKAIKSGQPRVSGYRKAEGSVGSFGDIDYGR